MPGKNVKDVIGHDMNRHMNSVFTTKGISGFIPCCGSVFISSQKFVRRKEDSPLRNFYWIAGKTRTRQNDTRQMADSLLSAYYEWYISYAKEVFDKLDTPE